MLSYVTKPISWTRLPPASCSLSLLLQEAGKGVTGKFLSTVIGQLVSPRKMCWSPNPQHLLTWPYLEIGLLHMWLVRWGHIEEVWIQKPTWLCPYRGGEGTLDRRTPCDNGGRGLSAAAARQGLMATTRSQGEASKDSPLQVSEGVWPKCCCVVLSQPVHGSLGNWNNHPLQYRDVHL